MELGGYTKDEEIINERISKLFSEEIVKDSAYKMRYIIKDARDAKVGLNEYNLKEKMYKKIKKEFYRPIVKKVFEKAREGDKLMVNRLMNYLDTVYNTFNLKPPYKKWKEAYNILYSKLYQSNMSSAEEKIEKEFDKGLERLVYAIEYASQVNPHDFSERLNNILNKVREKVDIDEEYATREVVNHLKNGKKFAESGQLFLLRDSIKGILHYISNSSVKFSPDMFKLLYKKYFLSQVNIMKGIFYYLSWESVVKAEEKLLEIKRYVISRGLDSSVLTDLLEEEKVMYARKIRKSLDEAIFKYDELDPSAVLDMLINLRSFTDKMDKRSL